MSSQSVVGSQFGELGSKHIAEQKPQIRGALRKPPDKPGIPISPIGDEDNRTITLAGEPLLFRALDAKEHLNLKIGLGEMLLRNVTR